MAIPNFLNLINTTEPFASWTNEKKLAIRDDLCAMHGYQDTIDGEPNPESKNDFCDRMIFEQLKRWLNGWRKNQAEAAVSYDEFGDA